MMGTFFAEDVDQPGGDVERVGFWGNSYGELDMGVPAESRW